MKALALVLIAMTAHAANVVDSHDVKPLEFETVFNEPGFNDQPDYTVENKVVALVNEAVPGSVIRLSQYHFNRPAIANALVAASKRGVDVRVVLDGSNEPRVVNEGSGQKILSEQLVCKEGEDCLKFCHGPISFKLGSHSFGGSCNGLIIDHNKFVILSELSTGDRNVVVQSSENYTDDQQHLYNDLIVIKNDKSLFDGFTAYWENLFRDHTRLGHFEDAIGDGPVRAKYFPRLFGPDPIMQMLKRVSCEPAGSMIRVVAADFTRTDVAARLGELARQGCDVKVLSRFDPKAFSPAATVGHKLGRNLIVLPYEGKSLATRSENSIHAKMMIIDAAVDGSSEKIPLVLTGSHNLDFFSLHTNDETLLEIQDQRVFDRYLKFWNDILDQARAANVTLVYGKNRS